MGKPVTRTNITVIDGLVSPYMFSMGMATGRIANTGITQEAEVGETQACPPPQNLALTSAVFKA